MAKRADLIKILMDDYGYTEEDLKFDADGKRYTNAKLQLLIDAEKEDEKDLENNKNRVVYKNKTTLKDHDKVKVMCGKAGTVYRSDMTRNLWKFDRFGQIVDMPYGELLHILNTYPRFYDEGWLVVLDKEVQEEFHLTEKYKNILTPDNIDTVFEKPLDELKVFIENLPKGMKTSFVNKAQELYAAEELNNLKVVKLIETTFNFSLEDNAPKTEIVSTVEKHNSMIIIDKNR